MNAKKLKKKIFFSSLVTTLRVAEKFEQSHLESSTVAPLIEAAQVFYVEGYFLTHGTSIVEWLSKKSSASNKVSPSPPPSKPQKIPIQISHTFSDIRTQPLSSFHRSILHFKP